MQPVCRGSPTFARRTQGSHEHGISKRRRALKTLSKVHNLLNNDLNGQGDVQTSFKLHVKQVLSGQCFRPI